MDELADSEIYNFCEQQGYFEPNEALAQPGKRFCLLMPPPNVTGALHIGHALTFTLQDIIIRYKRMDGYRVLYQPGLDHAGIATQNVLERELAAQGLKKEDLGREEFLARLRDFAEQSRHRILGQMRALGLSPAWSRLRFTLDEGMAAAVRRAFVLLYERGLIVRQNYLINHCIKDGALSDIEVEYRPSRSRLYFIKYFLAEPAASRAAEPAGKFILVATSRPETIFGDVGVMVHPEDERYVRLIGQELILPLSGRRVGIYADASVDPAFGTGAVKITPAHDGNDYEAGLRLGLEPVVIFDERGVLNELCGPFAGQDRLAAREGVAAELSGLGLLERVEEYENHTAHCYRCGELIEPYLSTQWFVKKEIAHQALARVEAGDCEFYPPQWRNSFDAWMRQLRDWCISRQLWWGHRIPVFYCECGREWASQEEPEACPDCGGAEFRQDEDVLDTWFSSGLWPLSTLGWGNGSWGLGQLWEEGDLEDFYPGSLLITGFDILFFWVARMIFLGSQAREALPFKQVYLHALVKDTQGRKMSKSLGNVIDPLAVINEYGADVLRFALALSAVQGRDIKLGDERLVQVRNFTNKLKNAVKFLLLKGEKAEKNPGENPGEKMGELARFMQIRLDRCARTLRQELDSYRFNEAATGLYKFCWDEFCDWGIELAKHTSPAGLAWVFAQALRLLHPFMPFLSEVLFHKLQGTTLEDAGSIMTRPYPDPARPSPEEERLEQIYTQLTGLVVGIRRAKSLIELGNARIKRASLRPASGEFQQDLAQRARLIAALARCEEVVFVDERIERAVCDLSEFGEVFIELEGVDLGAMRSRLTAQEAKLAKEVAKLENMLGNENFIKRAPAELVEENEIALKNARDQLAKIKAQLAWLAAL